MESSKRISLFITDKAVYLEETMKEDKTFDRLVFDVATTAMIVIAEAPCVSAVYMPTDDLIFEIVLEQEWRKEIREGLIELARRIAQGFRGENIIFGAAIAIEEEIFVVTFGADESLTSQ